MIRQLCSLNARYWGHEHSYSKFVGNIRQCGFVLKQPEARSTPLPTHSVPQADVTDPLRQPALNKQTNSTDESQIEGQMSVPSMEPSVQRDERQPPAEATQCAEIAPPEWLDRPLCVVDPFIRLRVRLSTSCSKTAF